MHISFLRLKRTIHLARKAYIALLVVKKVNVLTKYLDFANVFLEKSEKVLLEQTRANKYAIKLEEDIQPPYRPIYSLGLAKLKTFKTYIENNLVNNVIRASQ